MSNEKLREAVAFAFAAQAEAETQLRKAYGAADAVAQLHLLDLIQAASELRARISRLECCLE